MFFKSSLIAQAALAILSALPPSIARSSQKRATVCNGHAELCDRSYGNVSFVGAHNSYAVGVNNLATNQDYDIIQQLNDGIRMLQSQAHLQDGQLRLCHTSCLLYDGGLLSDYLGRVKSWMDDNPNEVVTLLIVNSDASQVPTSTFGTIFEGAGLVPMSYVPPNPVMTFSEWSTLGSMIDAGTRLVTFVSAGVEGTVPYILDEFTNIWETAFNVIDPAFDCEVNRTNGDPTNQMYLINHFLDKPISIIADGVAPDKDRLNQTNAAEGFGSLGLQAEQCGAQHGRNPNFMLVDFYEYGGGSVFQVAANLNGVEYNPSRPVATPIPDTSGTSTSTSNAAFPMMKIPGNVWAGSGAMLAGLVLGAWTVL